MSYVSPYLRNAYTCNVLIVPIYILSEQPEKRHLSKRAKRRNRFAEKQWLKSEIDKRAKTEITESEHNFEVWNCLYPIEPETAKAFVVVDVPSPTSYCYITADLLPIKINNTVII